MEWMDIVLLNDLVFSICSFFNFSFTLKLYEWDISQTSNEGDLKQSERRSFE